MNGAPTHTSTHTQSKKNMGEACKFTCMENKIAMMFVLELCVGF